ncbi:MAG: transcriptional regulator [Alphaproteobacteria bacterium]|nr:MAG: transcriptional regulator [Alphaproteobacteria bacterium]
MASPVRIEILKRLTAREWDVNSLSLELKIAQSALSQHLAKLRASELVDTRRDAQLIFYSSNSTAVLAKRGARSAMKNADCN